MGWAEVNDALNQSDYLLTCVLEGKSEEVAKCVDKVHSTNTSLLRYNDENSLACVLSLAFYTARSKYHIIRELPAGKGFADIVLVPRSNAEAPAVVLELKYDKEAATAIQQIKSRKYVAALSRYEGNVVLVGITYDKKTKHHDCLIEKVHSPTKVQSADA